MADCKRAAQQQPLSKLRPSNCRSALLGEDKTGEKRETLARALPWSGVEPRQISALGSSRALSL